MKKIYLFLVLSCLTAFTGFAQSSFYSFAQSSTTYTPVTTGDPLYVALLSSWDDGTTSTTIPFAFNVMGTAFAANANVFVSSNGYIEFGGTTNYTYTPNTTNTAGIFTIGANAQDLQYNTTGALPVRKSVLGSAPNRIFVVEWPNCRHFGGTQVWNFQIRLYETSNMIQMVYGSFTGNYATLAGYCGIWGPSATANNWVGRSVLTSGNWNSSSASTSRTSAAVAAMVSQIAGTTLPTSGLTFSYCPAVTATATPSTLCQGATLTLTSSTLTGATYSWSGPNSYTAATQNPSSFTVGTVSAGSYVVTAALGNCTVTGTAAVTVNPTPSGVTSSTGSFTFCSGTAITLSATPSGGTWSVVAGGTGAASVVGATGRYTGTSAGTVTARYTSLAGCTVDQTITVAPLPTTPTVTRSTTYYCSNNVNGPVTLTPAGTGTSFVWAPAASLTSSVSSSGSPTVGASPSVTTTYTVVASLGSCTSTATSTVTYDPVPTFIDVTVGGSVPSGGDTVCYPGTVYYFAAMTPSPLVYASGALGSYSSSDLAVATVGSATGTVYGVSTGTAIISYVDAGCSVTLTKPVIVAGVGFTLSASPATANYCATGGGITLTATPSDAGATQFLWTDGVGGAAVGLSGTSTSTVVSTPSAATTYYYVFATNPISQCHAQSGLVTVNNVTPVISGGTVTICQGASTTWSATMGAGTWTSLNTAIATVSAGGVVTGVLSGTGGVATIQFVNTSSGCIVTRDINVNATPVLSATPTSAVVCGGVGVTLTASGAPTYSWAPNTSLSATTGSTVFTTAASAITYTITGTSVAGCTSTLTKAVGVGTGVAVLAATTSASVCPGGNVTLSGAGYFTSGTSYTVTTIPFSLATLTGAAVTSVSGDETNSAALSLPFTFNFFGTNYTTFSLQCNGFMTLGSTIPATNYSASNLPNTAAPRPAIMIFGRDLNAVTALRYETFGTAPNRSFVVYFKDVSTFGSTDLAFDGQIILYETINVIDLMIARKSSTSTCNVGIQDATGTLYASPFGATSVNATGLTNTGYRFSMPVTSPTYAWTPTSGVTSTAAATTAAAVSSPTTYSLTVTSTAGCSGTGTVAVGNYPLPTVSISAATPCYNVPMTASGAVSYTWAPNTTISATTGATVTATPVTAITYTATGTSVNGCIGTGTKTINPVPVITASSATYCSSGSPVAITGSGGSTYTWAPFATLSSSAGTSVNASPSSTTTYTVTGTTAAGCVGTGTTSVTFNGATTVITGPSATLCLPGSMNLTQGGSGGTWSSSDPSVATVDQAGVVYGVLAGSSTTITYDNPTCGGSATYLVNVANGGFTVSVASPSGTDYCNSGTALPLTASNTGSATNYSWSPSSGLDATNTASVNASPAATTTIYTVTASDGTCANNTTVTINNITPAPISGGVTALCTGFSTTWTSSGGNTWSSSAPTVASVNSSTGVIAALSIGTATITYTNTSTGCYVVRSITINGSPSLAASPATAAVCSGIGVTLTASGASTYSWAPNTSLSATTGASVVSTAGSAITYTITGTSATGCTATLTKSVGVGSAVSATATASSFTVCAGSPVTLTGAGYIASGTSYTVTSVPFAYRTLTGAAVTSVSGDETNSAALSLPFTFNFFGTNYTTFSLQCNGFMTLGSTIPATNYSPNNLPSNGNSNPAILLFGRDLNALTAIQYETFGTSPNRSFVVYFKDVSTFGSTDLAFDGQIILYETSNIVDLMIARKSAVNASNVGIQNAGGTLYASPFGAASVNATGLTNTGYRFSIPLTGGTYAWTPTSGVASTASAVTSASVTGTTTYSVTATNPTSGCNATATTTVYNYPAVLPSITPATVTACIGVSTTLSIDQVTAGSGTWSHGSYGAIATVNSSTGAVTGVSAGTAVITFTNLCGTTTTRNVVVNPAPTAISVTPTVTSLCMGGTATLSNGTPGGTWTSSSPTVASINASTGVITTIAGGSTTFTYATGCGAPATISFSVNDAPVDITPLTTVDACIGQTTTLSEASLGGTWSHGVFGSIATVNSSTGVVTGVSAGTATITYGNGCGADVYRDVNVNPAPGAIGGFGTICQATSATLTNSLPGGTWVSNNTAIATVDATTGEVGGVAGGTTTISYVTTGCNAVTASETVTPLPAAIGGASIMCTSNTTTLTNTVPGGSNPWSSTSATGSGSINTATGVLTSTASVGTVTVSYTNTCGSVGKVVTVSSTPASISGTTSLCASGTPTVLSQNFNDTVGQIPSGGLWTIRSYGSNPASTNNWRLVPASPTAGTWTNTTVTGDGSNFIGANADAEGSGTTIKSYITSPTFSTVGLTTATLTFNEYGLSNSVWDAALLIQYTTDGGTAWNNLASFYGGSSGATSWTAGSPNYSIAIPSDAVGQPNVQIRFYYQSSWGFYWAMDNVKIIGPSIAPTSTLTDATPAGATPWSSGNTAIATINSSTGVMTGVAGGTTNITYTTPCGTTFTPVTINAAPAPVGGSSSVCVGATITLTNASTGGTWSSLSPTVATVNPSTGAVTGLAGGTSYIAYGSSCGASTVKLVTVIAAPTAITGSTALCPTSTGNLGQLLNTATGTWSSATPSAVTVNSATGVNGAAGASGTSSIITFTGTCGSATTTVTVGGGGATAPIVGSTTLCAPLATATDVLINNFNTSYTGSLGGTWNMSVNAGNFACGFNRTTGGGIGDGSVYLASSPTSAPASGANVELITPSFSTVGMTSATVTFNHYLVYAAAVSTTVDYSTNGGSSWTTITTYSASTGTTTWSSATPNGSVTLPAGALGNAATLLRWKASGISAGTGSLWYLDNFKLQAKYAPSTVYTDATPGGTWSSTNLAAATVSGGTVFGVAAGSSNISYSTSCGGVVKTITVTPAPGSITGASTTLCASTSMTLSNSSAGGTWSSSNTSVATVNPSTGVVTGVGAGTADITYVTACGTPPPYTLTVLAQPAAIVGATSLCTSSSATLTNTTTGGTWSTTAPTVVSINASTGVMTSFLVTGTPVTISYNNGCTAATSSVVVSGSPGAISGVTSLCVPSTGTTTLIDQNFTSLTGATGGTWSVVNTSGNSTSYFQIAASPGYSSLITGDGTNFAQAVPNTYGSGVAVTELRSPSFSTSSMTIATVSLNLYYSALSGDVVTLDYSTNGGSSWSNLASTGGTTFGTATWTSATPTYTTNLPAAALNQSNVMLRVYYSSNGGNWMGVDNVLVVANKFRTLLTDATAGGSWATTASSIASVNASSGIMTAVAAGTANISYTACSASVGTPVTIKGTPGAITGISPFCIGASITASNSATGGTWSVVNTAVATIDATTGQLYGVGAGSTTISYSNGCGNAVGTTITVKAPPAAIVGASSMCPTTSSPAFTSTTNLTNTVGGGTWTTSDPTVATVGSFSGVVTAALTGVSGNSVTITYGNGCGTDAIKIIDIDGTTDPIVGASTICSSPSPLVLTSFESGVPSTSGSPVDGWSYVQGVGAANGYFSSMVGASTTNPTSGVPTGGGTNVVMFGSNTITAGNTAALVSPAFDLTGANGGRVSFYMYRDGTAGVASNYDSIAVFVNTTPTIGGTRIGSVCRSRTLTTAFTGTVGAASWQKVTYTIPATISGATNYVVIKGVSAAGNNMYLDSLMIRNNTSVTTLTDATAGGTWSTSTPSVATVTATGIVSSVASITSSSTVTISYTGACGAPVENVMTVNPTPGTNTAGATTLCPGGTTTMANTNTVPGGTWSSSNGAVATVNASTGDVTAIAAGSAYISYTAGCGTPGITQITVNPLPTVAIVTSSATTLCAGSAFTLTAGSVTGTGGLTSYNWSGPAGYATTGTATAVTYTVPSASATGQYSLTVTYPGAGCTSAPVQTGTVTVNDYPIAYNVTGGNGCTATGIAVGLDNSQTSVISYSLIKSPSTLIATQTGTSTTLAFAPVTANGTYFVKATSAVGCITNMNGADTINTTPSASVSAAMPNICQPTASASIGISSIVGAPTTYNVTWDATALADGGFSNISGATLSGSSVTLIYNPAGGAGSFDGTLTLSNAACTSAPYPVHTIVHANPVVTVSAVNVPCMGYAGSIDFTGTDSATVSYSKDGAAATSFTFSGTTHNLSTGLITSAHNYLIIDAHNAVCTTAVGSTITIDPTPMAWVGGTGGAGHESEWNRTTNWSCGFVPTVADDVSIQAAAFNPVIPSAFTATTRNLTVSSGGVLVVDGSGKVEVGGSYNNSAQVLGAGKVVLNGASAQTITGIGTTNNLELNNSNGATINTGSRMVIGSTITIAAGTLTTNDSLELASTDTNSTARIAEIPASGAVISGKVKVDQYVMGGFRRYRFFGHPFSDTMLLNQLQPYIDITGPGGAANGFRSTSSNAPSAFRLDPYVSNSSVGYDPGWKAFTKINAGAADSNKVHPGQGIRLFFRGAKGEGLGYAGWAGTYIPSPTTFKMMGNVNQGNVSIPLAQGTSATLQSFNMVGNPYASPVDMGTVIFNARAAGEVMGGAFFVFDPSMGAGGQFVSVNLGGSAVPYYVQANTCIQVQADHDGAHIDFTESDKSASTSNYLYKSPVQYTALSVYDEKNHIWDMLKINFNDKATDENDRMLDAAKPMGAADFNFYTKSSDNLNLAVDSRPFVAEKVIPLGIASGYQQNFIIRADNVVVPAGGSLVLHDKLLEKYVDLKAGTEYPFTIGKDKATQGDRFELALKSNVPAAVKPLAVTMTPNPTTDDVKISFTSGKKEKVTVRVMDISGVSIYNQDLGVQQNGTVSVPLSTFAAGIYMVELTQGEQKVTQRLVKE